MNNVRLQYLSPYRKYRGNIAPNSEKRGFYVRSPSINDSFFNLIWLKIGENVHLEAISYKDDQYVMKYILIYV